MGVYPRSYPRSWPADSDRANPKPELFRSLGKVLNASQRSYCSGRQPAERDRALDLRCPTRSDRLTAIVESSAAVEAETKRERSDPANSLQHLSRRLGKPYEPSPSSLYPCFRRGTTNRRHPTHQMRRRVYRNPAPTASGGG